MRTTTILAAITLALGLASAGCQTPVPESPDHGLDKPVHPPVTPDLGHGPARITVDYVNVYWIESIQTTCKGPVPFFKFDSTNADRARNEPTMSLLADCMLNGPLRGKNIRLTGRTDPRGTEEYNEKLGLERADAVKRYLVRQGVPESRITTTSLGKDDASPAPKDWASDRRVQVDLAP